MQDQDNRKASQQQDSSQGQKAILTEANLQAIAQELGVPCSPGLKDQLNQAANNYLSSKHDWENREDTAELRRNLINIGKQAKKLRISLENLSSLGQLVFKQKSIDVQRTIGDILRVQETAENEVQHLKFGKGGPTENVPLIVQLPVLGVIYHEHTGKQPGMSTDPVKGYFRGPFFRFVTTWLKAVEPDLVSSEKVKHKIGKLIRNHLEWTRIYLK